MRRMTVAELISELQKLDGSLPVYVGDNARDYDINPMYVIMGTDLDGSCVILGGNY